MQNTHYVWGTQASEDQDLTVEWARDLGLHLKAFEIYLRKKQTSQSGFAASSLGLTADAAAN